LFRSLAPRGFWSGRSDRCCAAFTFIVGHLARNLDGGLGASGHAPGLGAASRPAHEALPSQECGAPW